MIHAKDIMVGDWVILYGSLTRWGYTDYAKWHNEMERTDIHAVEPVRITPEILEKNGFERTSDGWECNESDVLTIAIHDGDSCDIWLAEAPFDCKHITYVLPFSRSVHELQHCLKLVGIEKEIEL